MAIEMGLGRTFRSSVAIVASLLAITACATTTTTHPKPPAAAAAPVSDDASPVANDDDDDGDVEATNELPLDTSANGAACPKNMVLVANGERRFCVDKYEASLVEVDADGNEKPYPHWLAVDGHTVRAVSEPGVFPQGFISEVQAEDACAASSKRLCSHVEWKTACMGPSKSTFPYGDARQTGVCNDNGKSAVASVFGYQRLADATTVSQVRGKAHVTTQSRPQKTAKSDKSKSGKAKKAQSSKAPSSTTVSSSSAARSSSSSKKQSKKPIAAAKSSTRPASVEASVWSQLNDPRLGQVEGGLSKTGSHEQCVNGWGAVDMVGNLHEWVKTDPASPHGAFVGGYYLDTTLNGDGCQYKTGAHAHDYHDYSTGFRCCAEAK